MCYKNRYNFLNIKTIHWGEKKKNVIHNLFLFVLFENHFSVHYFFVIILNISVSVTWQSYHIFYSHFDLSNAYNLHISDRLILFESIPNSIQKEKKDHENKIITGSYRFNDVKH